jgi:hypothetical protein
MAKRQKPVLDEQESILTEADEGFLGRWSRLKSNAGVEGNTPDDRLQEHMPVQGGSAQVENIEAKTDADMPPLESLNEDSDYSVFFSSKVSEGLRRIALRKLFGSSKFNLRDGLDDYDEDFRSFKALGDILTSDMRHHIERALEEPEAGDREAQAEVAAAPGEESVEPDADSDGRNVSVIRDRLDAGRDEKGSRDDGAGS